MGFDRLDLKALDFVSIAERLGFAVVKKESTQRHIIMRSNDKKIYIYPNPGGVASYGNQRDPNETGTIIDLIKIELSTDFIGAKSWINGEGLHSLPPKTPTTAPQPEAVRDFSAVYSSSKQRPPQYLTSARGLDASIIELCADVREGVNGLALFFHRDSRGELCGYEYRGGDKKGFSKGGKKSLFTLDLSSDNKPLLVIVESAINALSYAQLLRNSGKKFNHIIASTAGRCSNAQLERIRELAAVRLCRVVLAQDNDEQGQGDAQAAALYSYLEDNWVDAGRHRPRLGDWNDYIKPKAGEG